MEELSNFAEETISKIEVKEVDKWKLGKAVLCSFDLNNERSIFSLTECLRTYEGNIEYQNSTTVLIFIGIKNRDFICDVSCVRGTNPA